MQKFEFLRQPLLGELAMSRKREEERKNAIYSGHLHLCQQPRAAHALRSDQFVWYKVVKSLDKDPNVQLVLYYPQMYTAIDLYIFCPIIHSSKSYLPNQYDMCLSETGGPNLLEPLAYQNIYNNKLTCGIFGEVWSKQYLISR